MDALIDAIRYEGLDAEIVVLVANKQCEAINRAQGFHITPVLLEAKTKDREAYDKELDRILTEKNVDLVLLIGFMRFLSKWFTDKWAGRVMNVHPSLLPDFAGGMDLNVHEEVLKAGKTETGATLHFVDETADGGPIIFQKKVAITHNETPSTLKAKVQEVEGELLVRAVSLFSKGKLKLVGNNVHIEE